MDSVHQVFVESGSNLHRERWALVLARVEHLDPDP